MSVTENYLSPSEVLLYQQRLNNADTAFGHGSAYNAYQQSLLDNSYNANLNDARRQWAQSFLRTQGGFAHRNLGESGIYHQALQNWKMNKDNAFGVMGRNYQTAAGGLGYQQQNLADQRDSSMNQTNLEREARQNDYATQIRAMQGVQG